MPIPMLVDTAVVVPANFYPLTDDTDFKTRKTAVAYNAAGMDLVWNFVTPAGVVTQTAVTPTTAGVYDWTHTGDGMYSMEIPASGGGSINNNTAGVGWFTGIATGVLAWAGPLIQFSPANVVNSLVTGGDRLQVDVLELVSSTQSATDLKDFADDGYDPSTNKVQGVVLTDTLTTYTGNTVQTGDSYARLGAPVGASISADVAGIQSDTNDLQARVPAALISGRIDASVGAMAAGTVTAAAIATDAIDADALADGAITAATFAAGAIDATAIATDAIGANELAASAITEIQAGLSTLDAAGVRTAVGLASANLDTQLDALPTNTELATALAAADDAVLAAIAALNNLSAAQVNAEMVDVLSTDTQAELASVPAANAALALKIGWLFLLARNKITQTGITQLVRNDGDSATVGTSTISDDAVTFIRSEYT